ncbi:heme A synthase [Rhodovibrio salinarum]|uniref:Heme A synthase n=2 Tax=Rhodovibrio salinarum TaxID=1087 RepID=A0A934V0Z8_9PROT|nr:COX15/CtaA family protein [Rhodovibrio salinarum]MBK1698877.1 heme A synthase [Rhodovibrio salinarum]
MSTLAASSDRADRRVPNQAGDRAVGLWLLSVAVMIFAMAVIGAITRLTESGLSIMEWAPISGTLPPLSHDEWERLFALYKTIPEYQQINRGMSLADFKEIFWWEWIHRLWGRLIGAVFAGGFLILLFRRKISRALTPHLIAMFALGGLQGLVGWYMVASGFAERTDVSQYRLAAHLGLALAIYAYVLWITFGLLAPAPAQSDGARALRTGLRAFAGLLAATILAGALVAGINAGLTYNTFPKMAGEWVPSGYWIREPTWANPFENPAAVQFNHRVLAVLTVITALGLWGWARTRPLAATARRAFDLLALAALGQLGLGIWTLLWVVPVWLGAAHQAGALTLLALTVWALTRLSPTSNTPTPARG